MPMRTYRRRSYRRKRSSTLARLARPKKTTAIQALAKQVRGLKLAMKKEAQLVNYYQTGGNTGIACSDPLTAINLSLLTSWNAVFGSSADDNESPSAIWKSGGLDMYFTMYSEYSNINFTLFLVKCKDVMAPYINLVTGAITLTNGTHFINSAAAGQPGAGLVMLNKKFFDILKIRRFTIGNNSVAPGTSTAQLQSGSDRRIYFKFAPNTKLVNPNGNWKDVPAQDPSQTYLLLAFNNNLTADGESPHLMYNYVTTVQV